MKQLSHEEFKPAPLKRSILLVCSPLQSPGNLGSLCRTAEAFGVEQLLIHQSNIDFLKLPRFIKTSRHSFKNIHIDSYNNLILLIEKLKEKEYFILGLEHSDQSNNLKSFRSQKKVAIIIGNEKSGIERSILDKTDAVSHIEMYGKNSSMNVTQATAIALYHCANFI